MKVTYHNVPYDTAAGRNTVVLDDSMLPGIRKQWEEALKGFTPDPPLFTPGYKLALILDSITGMTWPANHDYFADEQTATYMANTYGNGKLREVDLLGTVGPFSCNQKMLEFQAGKGGWYNAGVMASFFDRNPPDQFPGLADSKIRELIARDAALLGVAAEKKA